LYGLESDIYSIFDLISPTFQRISFAPIRNKTNSSSSPSIIYPISQIQDELTHPSCSYQSYDDICIISSDTNSTLLSFPNLPFQLSSLTRTSRKFLSSTLSYQQFTFYRSNSTDHYDISPSIHTPDDKQLTEKINWLHILIFVVPIVCGIILCLILSICAFIKYRRKDAGVYELVEAQRFRPLIVELPPSPGENHQPKLDSTKKIKHKSHQPKERKKSLLIKPDEQREFYI